MAFGLNLGHYYRQGALSWQGSDGKSKPGSCLSWLLLLQPHLSSPAAQTGANAVLPWPAGEQQVWYNSCLLCLHCAHETGKKTTQLGSFALKSIFKPRKHRRSPNPARGRAGQLLCMQSELKARVLCPLMFRKPRDRLLKRPECSSAPPAHSPECLSDRVTPQSMADPRPLLALRHIPESRNCETLWI